MRDTSGFIGQTSISKRGQKMKCIEYRNTDDIGIEFEDGTIVEHKTYSNFKYGKIRNPNIHIGEKYKLKDGTVATIKKYSQYNVTVQLSNGQVVSNIVYRTLQRGSLGRNPKYE